MSGRPRYFENNPHTLETEMQELNQKIKTIHFQNIRLPHKI